ncbi:outer membrane protein assembly factor BamE [Sinisalibacter aestuarii]|uniref:Outer membrane protein assembly factor BamE n=1 Tax=Sinisalibacter aestuarii TaxID=2949426 RepID=A0ABQ5LTC3_9RHOB|nr:outer membrane protein assembly factor BamE [Sinisalibacter aestuarii]GKY87576.1 outer membrane protein assembly factor BamE [Sinisalibacter aestuarii]
MSRAAVIVRYMVAVLALAAASACTPIYNYHGFIPAPDDLEEIQVGLDTRSTVEAIIGKPGASGLLAEGAWYYVRSEFKHDTFRAPEEIDRQVVAISFDEDGVVENVERFGLERGQVVALERRVTDSNIEGVSFLRQLFGNTGTLNNIRNAFN